LSPNIMYRKRIETGAIIGWMIEDNDSTVFLRPGPVIIGLVGRAARISGWT